MPHLIINFITGFVVTLVFSFFAAALIYKVLHRLLRFRAEWNTTYIACMMTVLICEIALGTSLVAYDSAVPGYLPKAVATTAFVSMVTGTIACRLIIRSRSGRHLPVVGAGFLAFVLTTPPTLLGLTLHFAMESA